MADNVGIDRCMTGFAFSYDERSSSRRRSLWTETEWIWVPLVLAIDYAGINISNTFVWIHYNIIQI